MENPIIEKYDDLKCSGKTISKVHYVYDFKIQGQPLEILFICDDGSQSSVETKDMPSELFKMKHEQFKTKWYLDQTPHR